MFSKKTVWRLFITYLFAIAGVNSTVIRTLDVASLVSKADVIVVGEVVSVVDRGPTTLDLGGEPLTGGWRRD